MGISPARFHHYLLSGKHTCYQVLCSRGKCQHHLHESGSAQCQHRLLHRQMFGSCTRLFGTPECKSKSQLHAGIITINWEIFVVYLFSSSEKIKSTHTHTHTRNIIIIVYCYLYSNSQCLLTQIFNTRIIFYTKISRFTVSVIVIRKWDDGESGLHGLHACLPPLPRFAQKNIISSIASVG